MRAALDDAALVDHADLVGVADRRQAVGDHDRGPSGESTVERALYEDLVLGVEVARGLVEDHHRRVFEQQAGDGEPLLLAARQPVAALADDRVETLRQRGDHVPDLRVAAGRFHLRRRGVRPGVAQVLADRHVEEVRVLGNDADVGAQRVLGEVAHVVAVEPHGARGDVVEPWDERGDRALAGTRWADERKRLAGLDHEGDVVEHLDVRHAAQQPPAPGRFERGDAHLGCRWVAERDVVQLDPAGG